MNRRSADPSSAEQDLGRLFTLALDLMCVAGLDGYFKRVNPAFQRVLGYTPEELMSCQFIDFVHEDDREATLSEVANLAGGAVTVDFENRYRTKSGDYRWLAWRSAPMVDRGLIFAVARDITQSKHDRELLARRTDELARSNADLEQFAYVASHDLRTPLRSVITLVGFIEEDLGDSIPARSKEHLTELRRRVLAMRALTDDLLVYSQAGRQVEEVVQVEVAELVREVVFLLDPPSGFEVVTSGEMPTLETVRGPLEQVLRNLVGNAIKHHDRDTGRMTISVADRGPFWEFVVSDDGPGMAAADRERAFQVRRFKTRPDAKSTGMGLAIVQRIVAGFGGTVIVDPGEGRGATFRFSWPKVVDRG
jgi:PAS domain S-box-containing protein